METAQARPEEPASFAQAVAVPAQSVPSGLPGVLARIMAWDLALLRWLGSLSLPRAAAWPLLALARIGDGYVWVAVLATLAWVKPWAEMQLLLAHGLAALAVSLAIYWPIKLGVRRLRPHESGLGITARVPPLDRFSFPSGHTMNNLAVALTVALYLPGVPGATALALALPLVFGALRILFGVHYLSDITGGALLGALSFWLGSRAFAALGP